MPKFPKVSGREWCKALEKAGFRFVRLGQGDHMIYRRDKPNQRQTVLLPSHAYQQHCQAVMQLGFIDQ